jgi:hypothetical protein
MFESWIGEFQVGAVEIVEIPENYLKTSNAENWDSNYRKSFRSILRGMIHAGVPVGLRLEHINDEMKNLLRGIRSPSPIPVQPEMDLIQVSRDHETDISEIVNTPLFVNEYMSRVGSASKGNPVPVARMLTVVAGKFCSNDSEQIPFAERLLLHAAGTLQKPKETAVLADILVAIRGVAA